MDTYFAKREGGTVGHPGYLPSLAPSLRNLDTSLAMNILYIVSKVNSNVGDGVSDTDGVSDQLHNFFFAA